MPLAFQQAEAEAEMPAFLWAIHGYSHDNRAEGKPKVGSNVSLINLSLAWLRACPADRGSQNKHVCFTHWDFNATLVLRLVKTCMLCLWGSDGNIQLATSISETRSTVSQWQ